MKKFLLACSLIGAISAVNAQSTPPAAPDYPPPMMHEHSFDPAEHAAHLQKSLQLSDEQTAKVKKVLQDTEQQRKDIEAKYKPQFEALHADMKKLHEQTKTQLNGILTPKQQQAFEAQHKDHGGMCRGHRGDKHDHDDKPAAK